MIDPELKAQLEKINNNAEGIRHSTRLQGAFWRGVLGGMGSIIGAAIAIAIIGWILNVVGVIPAFRQQANIWRQTLDKVGNVR